MTEKSPTRASRFLWICAAVLLAFGIASRLIGIWYAAAETGILYAESSLPSVLSFARTVLYTGMVGCALGAAVCAGIRYGVPNAWAAVGIGAGCIFLYMLSAFLIDLGSYAAWSAPLWVYLAVDALNFVWDALCLLGAYLAARRALRLSRTRALFLGTVILFLGWWIPQLVSDVSFLIEVEFAPYAKETAQIAGYHLLLLFRGGIAWLAATAFCHFALRDTADAP